MSPLSQSSVSTQIVHKVRGEALNNAAFYSPVRAPSLLAPFSPNLSTGKKNTNVRILSAVARRRNPYLVCEVDYLRALLGSPDAISKRFKGPTGKRVSWKRVLTALSLLTGHTHRNINGTRSRWGRTKEKEVSLEHAKRLLGDVLTNLDDTPDVEEGVDDEDNLEDVADAEDNEQDEFQDEVHAADPVDTAASKAASFEADLSIYPIDPVTAAQLVQSGAVKQAFAYPVDWPTPSAAPMRATATTGATTGATVGATITATITTPLTTARVTPEKRSHAPRLFDWSNADCCLGLVNCPVTKMRCDYCGETVNSTTRSYHKRCKKDFCVY